MKSIMPEGTRYFEVEELYVVPEKRSQGIGEALFRFAEETIKKDVQFIALSTASKTARRFYIFTWMNWGYSSGVRGYLRR